jgi:serine/threonine protein kinase
MQISPGTRLGPYEIMSRLGAGGMGKVFKARDTRLDRSVAIEVLSAAFADGPQFRTRFERDGGGIFVMGPTGESVRRLTASGYDPAWSPNGSQIVFAAEQTDTPRIRYNNKDLHVVDLDRLHTTALRRGCDAAAVP